MASIVLAGGGTAGHVLPALEVANELKKRFNKADILFIGSKGGADEKLVPAEIFQIRYLPKANFPRKLNLASITFIPRFSAAIIKSAFLLRGATFAVGFGGYVATPVYIAARILGIPIAIHEANSVPGLANRVGRKWAKVVAVFNPIKNWNDQHVIGFPMRNSIVEAAKLNGQDLFLAKVEMVKAKEETNSDVAMTVDVTVFDQNNDDHKKEITFANKEIAEKYGVYNVIPYTAYHIERQENYDGQVKSAKRFSFYRRFN